jgi:membrane associated rhomboid family serine protease
MANIGLITLVIIIVNFVFTYKGLKDSSVFHQYSFDVDHILIYKDYKRLVTSGFLHLNWAHFGFNMLSLFLFSTAIELQISGGMFLFIYFASLIGGNLFSLYIHRNHGDYSAVGASGAVCGIVFSAIALLPDIQIGIFLVPAKIPGWLFGLLYVLYSIYGIKSKKDNIGHEAHLGGALIGMILAIIMHPSAIRDNYGTILVILIPTVFFIYMIVTRPYLLLIDNNFFKKKKKNWSIDHLYVASKASEQQQIDSVLDKIHKSGIGSLTKIEKQILDRYSKSDH